MVNRLKTLYELQLLDDQLDVLEELRGDLPIAVSELHEKIKDLKNDIDEKERAKKDAIEKIKENEEEIEKLTEGQKKFKAQLYQVRNNKEYDALTKEIDHSGTTVTKLTLENESLDTEHKRLSNEIEDLKPLLETFMEELKVKEADLKEIVKANEKEETKLRNERKEIEKQAKSTDLSAYMRIRKAKKGKAVVTIKRSACSGCHNIVPSQKQLEIRRNNRLFFCEYCGRILVSPEIAEPTNTEL